jgi:DNA recombination protein RmuC
MNAMLLAVILLGLALLGAVAWAIWERGRASAATLALDIHRQQGDILRREISQSAAGVAEEILRRNEEAVRGREQLAQARLEAQLKPVAESLQKFQEQVTAVEKQRAEETGGLKEQISQLLQASTATQDEARKLSAALRRGAGVQGRWGEQTLRNVLEAAGLTNRYDFDEQVSTDGGPT